MQTAPPRSCKRACCRALFAAKCALSFVLAVSAIAVQAFWVSQMQTLSPTRFRLPPISSAASCTFVSGKLARIEPPLGTFMFGFSLQWEADLPTRLVARLNGVAPVVYNAFIKVTSTDIQQPIVLWSAQTVGSVGGALELTIDPFEDIDSIPDSQYLLIAKLMRTCNVDYGVPIYLRFGHEMNGGWMVRTFCIYM